MSFDRATSLEALGSEHYDLLVVGGGITGVGVALDAATRGLRTALVERDDFASGTSSKSSKLVHGGIRYLQQREVRLVYEALAERQVLRRNAPHLVRVLPFLLPVLTKDGLLPKSLARALGSAMWLYDLTGGLRIGKLHQRIGADEAHAHMPTLRRDRLAASYLYYDAHADDARLTLAIARTAADHGAVLANHARVTELVKSTSGELHSAIVEADGASVEVRTRAIVNATGVWADEVRELDEGRDPDSIRPAKGIHITLPWSKLQADIAVVIPVAKDRRSIFVVPWGDVVYVGTTDTDYDGPLDDPQCSAEDVRYLLDALNQATEATLTEADVIATWAGLRPLVRAAQSERTADLSRRHAVQRAPSGVVTITGGKLTTYRRMAVDTVDAVMEHLGRRGRSRTKRLRLRGAHGWDAEDLDQRLAARYGGDARAVAALIEQDASLAEPLVPGLPYQRAEAVYAVREEMATTLDDVLDRRTRARILDRHATESCAQDVAMLIGPELGWDDDTQAREVAAYRASLAHERSAAGLPEAVLGETTTRSAAC